MLSLTLTKIIFYLFNRIKGMTMQKEVVCHDLQEQIIQGNYFKENHGTCRYLITVVYILFHILAQTVNPN